MVDGRHSSKVPQIMLRIPALVLALASLSSIGVLLAQTPARHPLTLDDIARMADVRDPQCSPDGKLGRLRRVADRRQGRQEARRTSGWSASTAQNDRQITFEPGQRVVAALQPRRQVPVVHLVAAGQGEGQPGVAARSQRRRGVSADRAQGPAAGLRVVARLEAAGAGRSAIPIRMRRRTATASEARPDGRGASAPKPIVIDRYKYKQDGRAICCPAVTATSICSTSRPRSSIG